MGQAQNLAMGQSVKIRAMHLRAAALVETQHFFSKGHCTLARSLKVASVALNLEDLLTQSGF